MGGDVGGHANGDTLRAVDKDVREARREDLRLLERLVVVGDPVHRVFVEVTEQLHGRPRKAALGVAHGGGRVAVDVSKVAMAVHERHAHREPLGQTHHGIIDRCVSVRMVLTDDLADRPGRLLVGLVGKDTRLVHGIEDAPVHRLQAVAHVG